MKGKICVTLVLLLLLSGCAQVSNNQTTNPQGDGTELGEKNNSQEKEKLL